MERTPHVLRWARTPTHIPFAATLKLPANWKYGTSLQKASDSPAGTSFKPLSLTLLIDSPVITGEHFRAVPIPAPAVAPGQQTHFIDMVGESDAVIDMKPETVAQYSSLVNECTALFGARHYNTYHWLLTVNVPGGGLEHHESSDDRVEESALSSDAGKRRLGSLLAHEYIHSWNGKFRRPEGLATPDYQKPMKGELLWVYEGLTEYLATIVCPRAGLFTADDFHEKLAETAAGMDYTMGRQWRPLIDTTIGRTDPLQFPGPKRDYCRSTLISIPKAFFSGSKLTPSSASRRRTRNQSTTSVVKFHGGPSKGPEPSNPTTTPRSSTPLTTSPLMTGKKFLDTRLNSTDPHAPLGGITNAGWNPRLHRNPAIRN